MPDEGGNNGEQTPPADEGKTFSQADVDRVVQDRLARERGKFSDYDDLKAKAAKFDELDAANKSELEKANERAIQAEKKAEDAEKALRSERTQNAIARAATKAGFIDPDDAHRFIEAEEVDYDGEKPKNLDKILKSLAEAKPHLVKSNGGSGDGGPRGKSTSGETDMNSIIRRAAGRV